MAHTKTLSEFLAKVDEYKAAGDIRDDAVLLIDRDGDSRPVVDIGCYLFTDRDGTYLGSSVVVAMGEDDPQADEWRA